MWTPDQGEMDLPEMGQITTGNAAGGALSTCLKTVCVYSKYRVCASLEPDKH